MDNFIQQIRDKLVNIGVSQEDANSALKGDSREKSLENLNIHLGAYTSKSNAINSLRSFIAKGSESDVLSAIDKAAKKVKTSLSQTGQTT